MKFILRYKVGGQPNLSKLFNILQELHIQVLNSDLLPNILLVEMNTEQLTALQPLLENIWGIYQERIYKVPTTVKSVSEEPE